MVANESTDFFENLRQYRREGEDIRAFMDRVGLPRPAWYDWAKGADPKLSTARQLAGKLGISVDKLARGRDPDIDDAIPGWSQLTNSQREQIRSLVWEFVEASGGEIPLPRGETTPKERRAADAVHGERRRRRASKRLEDEQSA